MERPSKRAKVSSEPELAENLSVTTPLTSLHRQISPPPARSQKPGPSSQSTCSTARNEDTDDLTGPGAIEPFPRIECISSPIQLTHIRNLPTTNNVDTVKLRDILGDPMIRECWQFNYLFDVDFLMSYFDEDVRSLVQVKVVHGSWQKEAANRIRIEEACSRYPNVEPIVAYMPEPFGTHHSKMMILLRHDDLAQIIIHTANMIQGDWTNMTQAVWRSPLLPLEKPKPSPESQAKCLKFGSGARFKRDLLAYLKAYGPSKTGALVRQLNDFDFKAVRAALVASVPSRQHASNSNSDEDTLWGWLALKDATSRIPTAQKGDELQKGNTIQPHIVIQISSVATLGQTNKWLRDVFFKALAPKSSTTPNYSIVFPTPDEIRRSLDGYGSGGSIHMKTQSAAQQKQVQYLRPHLCQWAGDTLMPGAQINLLDESKREAGRRRAAPHIKTYICFANKDKKTIDWAMVSSANLSTQAWGAATNGNGEVRVCSWEIGVLIWPDLFRSGLEDEKSPDAVMVPCFKEDTPRLSGDEKDSMVVGFRMPYDLPLTPYGASDEPWCATAEYELPDWRGQSWT